MVHELIKAYKLTELMHIVSPREASDADLALFHSSFYLDYLRAQCAEDRSAPIEDASDDSECDSEGSDVDDEQLDYGLGSRPSISVFHT